MQRNSIEKWATDLAGTRSTHKHYNDVIVSWTFRDYGIAEKFRDFIKNLVGPTLSGRTVSYLQSDFDNLTEEKRMRTKFKMAESLITRFIKSNEDETDPMRPGQEDDDTIVKPEADDDPKDETGAGMLPDESDDDDADDMPKQESRRIRRRR